jgi:hypothetical protein
VDEVHVVVLVQRNDAPAADADDVDPVALPRVSVRGARRLVPDDRALKGAFIRVASQAAAR